MAPLTVRISLVFGAAWSACGWYSVGSHRNPIFGSVSLYDHGRNRASHTSPIASLLFDSSTAVAVSRRSRNFWWPAPNIMHSGVASALPLSFLFAHASEPIAVTASGSMSLCHAANSSSSTPTFGFGNLCLLPMLSIPLTAAAAMPSSPAS